MIEFEPRRITQQGAEIGMLELEARDVFDIRSNRIFSKVLLDLCMASRAGEIVHFRQGRFAAAVLGMAGSTALLFGRDLMRVMRRAGMTDLAF